MSGRTSPSQCTLMCQWSASCDAVVLGMAECHWYNLNCVERCPNITVRVRWRVRAHCSTHDPGRPVDSEIWGKHAPNGERALGTLVMTASTGMHDRANSQMTEGFRQGTETYFRARCCNPSLVGPAGSLLSALPKRKRFSEAWSSTLWQVQTRLHVHHVMHDIVNAQHGTERRCGASRLHCSGQEKVAQWRLRMLGRLRGFQRLHRASELPLSGPGLARR